MPNFSYYGLQQESTTDMLWIAQDTKGKLKNVSVTVLLLLILILLLITEK